MAYEVLLSPRAEDDLFSVWRHIADSSGTARAGEIDLRLRTACLKLADFPHRGSPHDNLAPGLRSVPLHRHATIYYRVTGSTVEIVRILGAGRDAVSEFAGT